MKRQYASSFLEESLGFAKGAVDPGAVPTEFVESLAAAMGGSEGSRAPEPFLEVSARDIGRDIIQSTLDTQGWVVYKERWPMAAKYAACLTHDVDSISRPITHVLRRSDRFSALDLLLALIRVRNLYDNVSLVADLERARNLRSSFYFLSGAYDLKPKAEQLGSMVRAGWEVGLHGDFGTHDSQQKMSEALSKINQMTGLSASGVREHYLHFDFASTWRIMEDAGLKYDTTVGNTDKPGFRIGLCNPFHPPDDAWRPRKLLELPLVLMDTTLWGYLDVTEAEGQKEFDRLKRSVESVNGLFTILWHQEATRMKGGRIYPILLDTLLKDGCFVGTGLAVAEWWQRRGSSTVIDRKTLRMQDAPAGLVLRSVTRGGEVPRATGAEVSVDGDSATIKARGGPLEVVLR